MPALSDSEERAGERGFAPDSDGLSTRLLAHYRVVRILAEAETLETAAPQLLEAIGGTLGWELGAIWQLQEDKGHLRCAATWWAESIGAFDRFDRASRRCTFEPGSGLPGRVLETREPAWIEDVGAHEAFTRTQAAAAAGLRAASAFPIRSGTGALGVIEFFSRAFRPFEPDILEMMDSFGTQIGQFIVRKRSEEEVRASEALNRAILESALDCVITIDAEGRVVDFNRAAEETFGYRREDALGEDMATLIVPPSLRQHHRSALGRCVKTGEARVLDRRLELTGMSSDGSEFPVELTITRIRSSGPPLFTGFVRDITARKQAEAEMKRLLEQEREAKRRSERLVADALEAEQRERRHLSEALHDGAVQNLHAARLDLEAATEGDPAGLMRLEAEIEGTLAQLREVIAGLHPVILERAGLQAAIEALARRSEGRGSFRWTVRVASEATGVHDELLLSVTRELLANAAKHARAKRVSVSVERERHELVLKVADDGEGMPAEGPEAPLCDGHIGLASVAARVEAVGGRLEIESEQGQGTMVEARIPAVSTA